MHRSDLQPWGQADDDRTFWRAVAALGVARTKTTPPLASIDPATLVAEALAGQAPGRNLADEPGLTWFIDDDLKALARAGALLPAQELASVWDKVLASGRIPARLDCMVVFDNHVKFAAEMLRHAGVTVVHLLEAARVTDDWQWPLRLVVPEGDHFKPWRDSLVALRSTSQTANNLTRLWGPRDVPVAEFLLLRSGLQAALAELEAAPLPLRAQCLLILDSPALGDLPADQRVLLQRLHQLTLCRGVVLASVTPAAFEDWMHELLRTIAHDEALDAALSQVSPEPPLMFFEPGLLRLARIGNFGAGLVAGLREAGGATLAVDDETSWPLGLPVGEHAAAEVAERLEVALAQPAAFDQERRGASLSARVARAARHSGIWRRAIGPAAAAPEPRRVQVDVRVGAAPARTFSAGLTHDISVFIGSRAGMLTGQPLPEHLLPAQEDGHLLTATLFAPGFLEQPLLMPLYLPRAGDSPPCMFSVPIGQEQPWFEARLSIAYRNRTLQTYLLRGGVQGVPGAQDTPIELVPEMCTQPDLGGLDGQRDYGATFVVNRMAGQKTVMAQAGYQVVGFAIDGLDKENLIIESKIDGSQWDSPTMMGLQSEASQQLLRFLAIHGATLFNVLRQQLVVRAGGEALLNNLLKAHYLQVMAANLGARLPIEFFYANDSPDSDAGPCPLHQPSVGTQRCGDCPHRGRRHFCPSAFWALDKAIEWQHYAQAEQHQAEFAPRPFAVQYAVPRNAQDAEPAFRRDRLPTIDDVVIGVSNAAGQVDTQCVPAMVLAIAALGVHTHEASDWTHFENLVREERPGLIVLLPHVALDNNSMPSLEIGGDTQRADTLSRIAWAPPGTTGPVLLLLGCNTDNAAGVDFRNVPVPLSENVPIIVSTISHVLGRHAAPLAAELACAIVRAQRGEYPPPPLKTLPAHPPFAEVMCAVRRGALRENLPPLALALKCYGDARWLC